MSAETTQFALRRKSRSGLLIAASGATLLSVPGLHAAIISTYQNPAPAAPSLTYVAAGVYTSTTTLNVGDSVDDTTTAAGLTANRIYYVTAVSGSNVTLSTSPGGVALTATTAGTATSKQTVNLNAASSFDTVPNSTDAVVNIATDTNLNSTATNITANTTIGSLNFSGTQDLGLFSSNNGTSTTLSTLDFATSTGVPDGHQLVEQQPDSFRISGRLSWPGNTGDRGNTGAYLRVVVGHERERRLDSD